MSGRGKGDNMRTTFIRSLPVLLICLVFGSSAAQADILFCNKFKVQIWIAIAYPQSDGSWLSRGWISPNPNECLSFDSALHIRTFYYRAVSQPFYERGRRHTMQWGRGKAFAVWDNDNFEYWNAQYKVLNSTLENFSQGPVASGRGDVWLDKVTVTFGPGAYTTVELKSH